MTLTRTNFEFRVVASDHLEERTTDCSYITAGPTKWVALDKALANLAVGDWLVIDSNLDSNRKASAGNSPDPHWVQRGLISGTLMGRVSLDKGDFLVRLLVGAHQMTIDAFRIHAWLDMLVYDGNAPTATQRKQT